MMLFPSHHVPKDAILSAHGIHRGAVPGPLRPPQPSVPALRPAEESGSADPRRMDDVSRGVLATLQVPPDDFNTTFFSRKNLDELQTRVVRRVRMLHKVHLDRQSDPDMLLLMRQVYLEHMRDSKTLRQLNDMALQRALDSIRINLSMRDLNETVTERAQDVIDYGVSTSSRGLAQIF